MTESGKSSGKTILVVEDDLSLREMVREVLESEGYLVLEAGDVDQALSVSRVHAGTIDLALTDVIQPKMSGRELADELLADRPGLRIIFMSGYLAASVDPTGADYSGEHFLEKPFKTAALLAKVREVLEDTPPKE